MTAHKVPPGWTGERYVPEIDGNIRFEHLHRYLIAREFSRNQRVLDIACGEGYGSAILASVASHVVGVDIAGDVVTQASSTYTASNVEFIEGSCEAIPLPDDAVDVVVSFETIEHVGDHELMMSEIRRVLRPGGLLVISSPDRREYSDTIGNRNPFHVKELDREEFERLLRSSFSNVALAGQRIRAGSMVGPLEESTTTRFVSFPSANSNVTGVQGMHAPVYLLALACADTLPAMPVGLLDGGAFTWQSDLEELLAQAYAQCAVEIGGRLGDVVRLEGATVEEIRAAFIHQTNRVADVSRAKAEADTAIAEAKMAIAEANTAIATANVELTAARDRNAELSRAAADANAALETANSELTAARVRERRHGERISELQSRLDIVEHSHSWRLTAPIRVARRVLGTAVRRVRSPLPRPAEAPTSHTRVPRPATDVMVEVSDFPQQARPKPSYDERTADYVPLSRSRPVETRLKPIAFYLPQFHPIPENDEWWGRGFTEWTSVTRAKPQFEGHYQPHLPGELGFYDLRLPEIQKRQIELARLHGIQGFCYYHYWFDGRKLLRQPLDQLLARPDLDFPFCLCWANENWTRRWDGREGDVLMAQRHTADDDLAFIRDIEPAFRDRRYLRVGGRPLLLVYRAALFPDARATAERWRTYCRNSGIGELFLMSIHGMDNRDPRDFGFDAALEFAPNTILSSAITHEVPHLDANFQGEVFDYRQLVSRCMEREPPDGYQLFRSVAPMWDNEARRPARGAIYKNSTPSLYREWLEATCRWTERHLDPDKPFVFVNAWNEWAEGAHLEPDRRYGYAYLEATAKALEQFPPGVNREPIVCVTHDAQFNGAQLIALNLVRMLARTLNYDVHVVTYGPGPLTSEFEAVSRVHDFALADMTREDKLAIIRELYGRGARIAICNTSVVGEAVELFKLARFSVVSLVHELPQIIRERRLEGSVERIATHADHVVFPAGMVRDNFRSLVDLPSERCVIQPQGLFAPNAYSDRREVARQELRTRLGLPAHARIVIGVGYADHRKGIDWFVEAGLGAIARRDDVFFVWVGAQEPSAFATARARLDGAGSHGRFLFPGPIRDPQLFYAGADAYLMTSREDPFPSVILEALDAGLPVIGFEAAGGFGELLKRGCGVLVPFGDTGAMAAAVLRLLDSPAEGADLTAVGREILAREFSYVNYTRTLVELVSARRPKVSVVVPNYNYARHLPARLTSIVHQTYPPHEVIFLDDCSSDDSVDVATPILHASGLSYRVITNAANQGTYRQWLRGVREATGDLIWIAEADDDCAPELLERLVSQFERPEVMLAYCQSRQIDEQGREIAPDYLAYTADISDTKWRRAYIRPGLDEITDTLVVKNTIPNVSAVLMRRPDLSGIEQQLLALRNTGDWLLYIHLLEQGSIAFVPDALNFHRRHSGSVTIGYGGLNLMRETLIVQQHVLHRHGISPDVEMKRKTSLQVTYEYLGLHAEGPASYRDHDSLRTVDRTSPG
jgi:glycosyltransferase involved in cell wall biosynthesis/SAM-dependent methyltransferase